MRGLSPLLVLAIGAQLAALPRGTPDDFDNLGLLDLKTAGPDPRRTEKARALGMAYGRGLRQPLTRGDLADIMAGSDYADPRAGMFDIGEAPPKPRKRFRHNRRG